MQMADTPYQFPDASGHFGPYGGIFVAETLMPALAELREAYAACQNDPEFIAEFEYELKHYVGRPSPIYHARRWSELLGGAQIYLKREDLNHTGAHKVNNCIGQAMVARRMGKPRVIAETGAGQHGVATATVAARYGMECVVYMGSEDVKRQAANVYRMKLLGATVVPVESGSKTLKDALNEAMRDWVTNVADTFYIIGTVAGPHPYPMMVRDFQSVIGKECLVQMPDMVGRQPDYVIACVGGGSNAMGIFHPYIGVPGVRLVGVEAAGDGLDTGRHSASLTAGRPGVLHGNRTYLLQDDDGQIIETHSVSAGLDYPGVGPEHAWLKDIGRAEYQPIRDDEALRDWVTNIHDTFYLIGTAAGPHPYPAMVRDFQAVIGRETRAQMLEKEGRLPDSLVACIGGGSNAIGLFHEFLDEPGVQIVGVEAAGHGIDTGKHASSMAGGTPGVLHGNRTFLLQDADGQITDAHSVSAGLDYPGVGPEHAWLHEVGRVEYVPITDDEAMQAFQQCCRLEGIIPALESSHALAEAFKRAPRLPKDHLMVINLSGRGDKDMQTVMHHLQDTVENNA